MFFYIVCFSIRCDSAVTSLKGYHAAQSEFYNKPIHLLISTDSVSQQKKLLFVLFFHTRFLFCVRAVASSFYAKARKAAPAASNAAPAALARAPEVRAGQVE